MIFNTLFFIRNNTDGGELRTVAICYNDSTFAMAVSSSVDCCNCGAYIFLFRDTAAAFLGFQGESSLCRVRCQIQLQRANRLVCDYLETRTDHLDMSIWFVRVGLLDWTVHLKPRSKL
jgi:hypothetical protein